MEKFQYKTEAELTAMTPEQRDKYASDKREFEANQQKAAIDGAISPLTTKLEDIEQSVAALKDGNAGSAKPLTLKQAFREQKDQIKALKGTMNTNTEVVVKALTQRSSITDNEQAFDLPDIGQLATRKVTMYDAFPKLRISSSNHNGVIRYYDWDEDTIVRAAAMVAEGAAFPESTAKFKKYSLPLQKVGDTLPVTEEFFEDEEMFAAELGMFLETNVNLEIDSQICNGDGTGNNLTGLFTSAPAYTPVASSIQDANIYDLIQVMAADITRTGGAKYMPDVAFLNITDILRMRLKKDMNNNYILPPFVSRDGQQVGSIVVLESNIVTANQIVVGDRRFARIYEIAGLVLSRGMINAQFTEDEMTMKVRKRLLFLIRQADKSGWRKVTDITTALTTLAGS
jgi:HK97 family phage major capsid protein